jgi:hypothetical protein
MYRCGGNYKNHGQVIFSNPNNKSLELVNAVITQALQYEEPWFYVNDWKLPDLHFEKWDNELDHTFHEFESIEYTNNPPNDTRSIEEFLEQLSVVSG